MLLFKTHQSYDLEKVDALGELKASPSENTNAEQYVYKYLRLPLSHAYQWTNQIRKMYVVHMIICSCI